LSHVLQKKSGFSIPALRREITSNLVYFLLFSGHVQKLDDTYLHILYRLGQRAECKMYSQHPKSGPSGF
jgi:hypothetical protein